MLKAMKYNSLARRDLSKGIEMVCSLLIPTYGPRGSNVLIEPEKGYVYVSGKSSEIIRDLKVKDLFLDEGVQLAKEAIMNTEKLAGDGGTTTACLLMDMVQQGMKYLEAGANPILIRKGLKTALEQVVQQLEAQSFSLLSAQEFEQIAAAASGDTEIGKLLAQGISLVGVQGNFFVKETKGTKTEIIYQDGLKLESGILSSSLSKDGSMQRKLNNACVLITDEKITRFDNILPILEEVVAQKSKLLIVAESIEGEALTMLQLNQKKGIFDVSAVNAPGYGDRKADILEDLAAYTGTHVIKKELGEDLARVKLSDLGFAREIIVDEKKVIVFGDGSKKNKLDERIQAIHRKIQSMDTSQYDKARYLERLGWLNGGIAVINVGAYSNVELHEKKVRVEAAIRAVKTAQQEGVLPGGGDAYRKASAVLESITIEDQEERMGLSMLKHALQAPYIQLSKNHADEKDLDLSNVNKKEYYSEQTDVFDSAAVLKTALDQAVSVVYEWLSTQVLMVSTAPDREDIDLMKQGVGIMR